MVSTLPFHGRDDYRVRVPPGVLNTKFKGYPTEKDYAKWNQFPNNLKLDIYFGDELLYYNIITDAKNVYSNVPQKFRNKH